jgi:hypothetical protein
LIYFSSHLLAICLHHAMDHRIRNSFHQIFWSVLAIFSKKKKIQRTRNFQYYMTDSSNSESFITLYQAEISVYYGSKLELF